MLLAVDHIMWCGDKALRVSLEILGSVLMETTDKGSLGIVRIGVMIGRSICVYTFIKLYTIHLLISVLVSIKWLPQPT